MLPWGAATWTGRLQIDLREGEGQKCKGLSLEMKVHTDPEAECRTTQETPTAQRKENGTWTLQNSRQEARSQAGDWAPSKGVRVQKQVGRWCEHEGSCCAKHRDRRAGRDGRSPMASFLLSCATRPNVAAHPTVTALPRVSTHRHLAVPPAYVAVPPSFRATVCANAKMPRGTSGDDGKSLNSAVDGWAGRVVAASSAFMVIWVLLIPGSAFTGIAAHDVIVENIYEGLGLTSLAPTSLLTKYNTLGQWPAVTHALPGAIWCSLVPLQLRGKGDATHRALGRVMLSAASVLMVGYAIIDANGLTADVADFGGHGGALADAVDETLPNLPLPFNSGGLKTLAGWFVLTGVQTAVTARAADTRAHRTWAVRHVASGLWVAAQRPLFGAVRLLQIALLGGGDATTSVAQADAFYACAYLTTGLYVLTAEVIAGSSLHRK